MKCHYDEMTQHPILVSTVAVSAFIFSNNEFTRSGSISALTRHHFR